MLNGNLRFPLFFCFPLYSSSNQIITEIPHKKHHVTEPAYCSVRIPRIQTQVFPFLVFSKIMVYFEPFFRVKNGSQASVPQPTLYTFNFSQCWTVKHFSIDVKYREVVWSQVMSWDKKVALVLFFKKSRSSVPLFEFDINFSQGLSSIHTTVIHSPTELHFEVIFPLSCALA